MFEQIGSVFSILTNLTGLMVCLFHYVRRPRKEWIYVVIFLLCCLLSNYYWGVYVVVMGDYPNVSSLLAYFGWDFSFVPLVILLLRRRRLSGEKKVSPLAILPIPLNIWQFMLYIQFGGLFNNLVQVSLTTMMACLSINAICVYLGKGEEEKETPPYIPFFILCYCMTEYASWTASCFDWPSEWQDPYSYASLLSSLAYLLIPVSVSQTYSEDRRLVKNESRLQKIFKPAYFIFVVFCCVGGFLLASWMRDTIAAGIDRAGESDPYSVIAVVLFVVSIVIVLFSVTIILVASFAKKTEETAEFKQAKVSAERSNAAKSDFLANMSHEIRTPINAVLGMNEMIMREALKARDYPPEEKQKVKRIFSDICGYAGSIDSAGKNLLSIINDILDFSKIEAGKMELVNAEYRLSSVLNDVGNMISFKAKAKDLKFIIDADGDLPENLYGDEVRVRQIIINLLNNAVKYTQNGSVTLTVRTNKRGGTVAAGERAELIFTIRDTGIGIRKEDIARLFGKFERMDLEKNSTVEGTGLGLAITKSLLDMMGGDISVESDYGKGSVFTVLVPQKVVSDGKLGDYRETVRESLESMELQEEAFYAPGVHILVVDDTRLNLMVVKGLLKDTGVVIDTAESGTEAIELANRFAYDMILMDQRMPEMDGTTAMKRIRELSRGLNEKTPFICLTADAVTGARERYIASGFEDYLTKPIGSQALEDMLLRYLPAEKIRKQYLEPEKEEEEAMQETVGEVAVEEKQDHIDRGAGLRFCGGKESFYKEILKEYLRDSASKRKSLERYYDEKNWKDYEITVHALKSSSRMIGAGELADIAARLEQAAKVPDADTIEKEQDGMMKIYGEVISELKDEFGDAAGSGDEDDTAGQEVAGSDGEILLEFSPAGKKA